MKKLDRPAPLGDQVFSAIHGDILAGRLKAGDKLPIEPQLAADFGVSRTVIREALSRLRNDGLVTAKQGAGVFVAAAPMDRTFRLAPQSLENATVIREIFELRLGIEVAAAGLAARRRSPSDVQRLERALVAIEATKDGPDFGVEADAEFHRAIALSCGNSKIASFQRYLAVFLVQSITAARAHTRKTHPGMVDEVRGEHRAILDAVKGGDEDAAEAAMRAHLVNAQKRLGVWEGLDRHRMQRLR